MKANTRVLICLALLALMPQAARSAQPEIAYQGNTPGIWVMDADGTNETLVCEGHASYAHWSRDGNSLVFLRDDAQGVSHLYRVDLAGSPSGCTDVPLAAQWGEFSVTPDTPEHLLFLDGQPYGTPGVSSIYDGLGSNPAHWSPARDEIAVQVSWYDRYDRDIIAVADPWSWNETLVPIYITEVGAYIDDFAWSPDGSRLAVAVSFSGNRDRTLRIVDRWTGLEIPGMSWAAADMAGIEVPNSAFAALDWSHTEASGLLMTYMSFYQVKPNDSEWFIVVTDFGDETPSAERVAEGRSPSWSPDDTQIVFSMRDHPKSYIVATVNLATLEITPLGGATVAMWSWNCPDWKRGYVCGDGTCDPGENPCVCPTDCGPPPITEIDCYDGVDDDCDLAVDCADDDCSCLAGEICCDGVCGIPLCESDLDCDDGNPDTIDTCVDPGTCEAECVHAGECGLPGDPCTVDSDCCDGRCHLVKGTCK